MEPYYILSTTVSISWALIAHPRQPYGRDWLPNLWGPVHKENIEPLFKIKNSKKVTAEH